ncbi:MAG: hypothetical protein AAGI22_11430 [Planctomycetota bacterium]
MLALLLTIALVPGLAQQCEQVGLDILERPDAVGVDRRAASTVVVGDHGNDRPPALYVFDAAPGTLEYVPTAVLRPPAFEDSWSIREIAIDGDVIAHYLARPFSPPRTLFVHERTAAGWSYQEVSIPGVENLRLGELVDVDDGRAVVVAPQAWWQPVDLVIVERNPAGVWEVVDVASTDILAPYIDYAMQVVLDGDIAAIGQFQLAGTGRVAVCEPDASGSWSQTALIDGPTENEWAVDAIALEGEMLAVVRTRLGVPAPRPTVLQLHERGATGAWRVVGRRTLSSTPAPYPEWAVELDLPRVAVSSNEEASVFLRTPTGDLVLEHTVTGLRRINGFVDGRMAGMTLERRSAQVIQVPQSPGVTALCPLRGLQTCAGTGTARLRIQDTDSTIPNARRASAEITGAPPGAAAFVLRSADPGASPALGGRLCIDRRSAVRAAPPQAVDASGRVTFPLFAVIGSEVQGFAFAHHLQGVVLTPVPALTNSLAWLR